jgi:3-hydroxybutyryl-CoA dehydrogenase
MNVSRVAVVGSGTMASGIVQVVAQAGIPVSMVSRGAASGEDSLASIQRNLQRDVERGRMTGDDRSLALSLIDSTTSFNAVGDVELVIEAVVEDVATKLEVFERLDELAPTQAVLASNTSSISITLLASATKRAAQVVGMHFFNPVPAMPLVEVVCGLATSDDTVQTAKELASRLGKTPVVVNDYPGFVSNRVLMPMINEAIFCLMEGVATRDNIDEIMKLGMNHPIGPLALADHIGLDVCLDRLSTLHRELGDPKFRPCPLLIRMVNGGKLGRKSGAGFYDYRSS